MTFFLHCQKRHPELPKIPTYLPRITTAIDLHAKGDLLVAACRELEYKNALSAALFKRYFNFDDGSCLRFLGWLFDPSNFGTAPHGDVHQSLQNSEVEYLVLRKNLHPDNDYVHPSQSMPSSHRCTNFAEIGENSPMTHASPLLRE